MQPDRRHFCQEIGYGRKPDSPTPLRPYPVPRSRFLDISRVANLAAWRMPVGMSQGNVLQLIRDGAYRVAGVDEPKPFDSCRWERGLPHDESKERLATHRARHNPADGAVPRNRMDSPKICHRERFVWAKIVHDGKFLAF